MPDSEGKFRGIHVSKVWPGHKDYDQDVNLKKDEAYWAALELMMEGEVHIPRPKKHD